MTSQPSQRRRTQTWIHALGASLLALIAPIPINAQATQKAEPQATPAVTTQPATTAPAPVPASTAPQIIRGPAISFVPGVSRSFPATAGFSYQAGYAVPAGIYGTSPFVGGYGSWLGNGPYQPVEPYAFGSTYPGYGFGTGAGFGYLGYGASMPPYDYGFNVLSGSYPNGGMPYYGMPRVYIPARGGYWR